ncbi:hypothetical protein BO70DRAFT_127605 [Aspergillus heteromorphus CBS 117.55]|uniref:Uncharacterized protein n=1 Tax=Aspergillus heteromorphus CBS 117.55 TaxID=1448321 RepID=A0A317WTU5_9EURO|nr:uncharacterized protein BO70DRAFT_127605 [Aspergillus heteromorphus CBS 117.55]PWY89749.1 hypothetical protein BO70DRAFT_127605 [Aspergillus heteromorphus CBS 117.55]
MTTNNQPTNVTLSIQTDLNLCPQSIPPPYPRATHILANLPARGRREMGAPGRAVRVSGQYDHVSDGGGVRGGDVGGAGTTGSGGVDGEGAGEEVAGEGRW